MFDFGLINDSQKQAVLTTEGPVLIIAGPGTGKTFTLVKRLAYLVTEKHVKPSEIMVVTFTEKAGKELLTRISNEFLKYSLNVNINEMYIGTFHSVCLRLMKENSEFIEDQGKCRMLDAFEQTYLVCRNIELFNRISGFNDYISSSQGVWQQAMEICRYVNQMMEELVDIDAMENDFDEDIRFLAKLVKRYKELLKRNNAMDFSSIQTKTFEMLAKNPNVLKKIQDSIRYIMVDEYQDTNYIQEQLVFAFAGERKNICVVGDDDQGMYRFRGATIRNILEFPSKFAEGECRKIHLDTNYRSEPDIINFYNDWMENVDGLNLFNWNKFRYPKNIVAGKTKLLENNSVYICGGDSVEQEKTELLNMILNLKHNGNVSDYNQIAFLFRSVKSAEATEIGEYLEENGIPIYSPRSDMFFSRTEIKQITGLLIICFYTYTQDLKNNNFRYKISESLRRYFIDCVKSANVLMKNDPMIYKYVNSVMRKVNSVDSETNFGLLDIFYRIISFEPFKSYLEADLNDNVLESRAARNLSEFSRIISRYNYLHDMHRISFKNKLALPEEFFNIYLKYLYEDGVGEYEDESEYSPSGCISFMTIHQSKGLEFPVVVVGSLGNRPRKENDSLLFSAECRFFNRESFEPIEDIKYFDFWRLYYTAFSRAQNLLVLAAKSTKNKYFGRYIESLPDVSCFESNVKFESVKEVNYKHVYSFTSHISVYDSCPVQYKFYKEYGFAQNKIFHTSVGSLVHATLEDMNKCIISGNIERINDDSIKEWFRLNYNDMKDKTGYYLTDEQQENALSQVIRYYNYRKNELGKVWKAEEEINLVLPDYILKGIIDLIESGDNTVEIVDYKTGVKPDAENYPERVEHYRKQLEVYAYLIEQRYGKKVSRMHLYYTSTLSGNPIISFDRKNESIENTIKEISDTIKKIESRSFNEKVQNPYTCQYCDMRFVCGKEFVKE